MTPRLPLALARAARRIGGRHPAAENAIETAAVDGTAAERDRALPEIDWARPPEAARLDSFPAPSGDLARMSMGDPACPTVLLVPGVTGSKEDFTLMMPELAGPERRIPPGERYDHALFVDDLLAVLAADAGPAHVVGYSFAGTIAQMALIARPDLFRSITLLSCPPLAGNSLRGMRGIGRFSSLVTGRTGASLMIWGIRRNFTRVGPARLAFINQRFRSTRRSSIDDVIGLMKHTPDLTAEIALLPVPVMVAVGDHDVWGIRLHRRFARALGGRLAIYRTGHSPCETMPHQLARDLDAFYRERE
jgi:pimeloyl-ACP methyl ester carboxylesterase